MLNYENEMKKEAIRLGLKYQLATVYTSFVAVEERDTAVEGSMTTVAVCT